MFFAGAFLFWLVTMPKAPHVTVQVRHHISFAGNSATFLLLTSHELYLGLAIAAFEFCAMPTTSCFRVLLLSSVYNLFYLFSNL